MGRDAAASFHRRPQGGHRRPPGRRHQLAATAQVLTVADIIALPQLELEVAGGDDGRDRVVRWAHISELDDPTPWLRGGELLLTTGQPLQRDPAGFVERLAHHGLAGICLGLGFGFDEMPADAATAADRLGFPAITTPYHVPFIAITEAVFTAQGDARVQTLERLTELMLDGRDLDAMLTEMGRVAGTALVLREPSGRILARTGDIADGDPGAVVLPVVTGSTVHAELVARPAEHDRQLLHHVQTVLAVELLKRRAVAEAQRRLSGGLVEAILAGGGGGAGGGPQGGGLRPPGGEPEGVPFVGAPPPGPPG